CSWESGIKLSCRRAITRDYSRSAVGWDYPCGSEERFALKLELAKAIFRKALALLVTPAGACQFMLTSAGATRALIPEEFSSRYHPRGDYQTRDGREYSLVEGNLRLHGSAL